MRLKERSVSTSAELSEELSIAEIDSRYANEWVLIEETALDDKGYVSRGRVLCHSMSGAGISRAFKRAWKREPRPHLYRHLAGPTVCECALVT